MTLFLISGLALSQLLISVGIRLQKSQKSLLTLQIKLTAYE